MLMPQAWYMHPAFSVLIGGILPFGAVFIELFFILTSMWLHQFYYLFGFLCLVFVILVITCAEITIVLCYFQLCSEDYHWWCAVRHPCSIGNGGLPIHRHLLKSGTCKAFSLELKGRLLCLRKGTLGIGCVGPLWSPPGAHEHILSAYTEGLRFDACRWRSYFTSGSSAVYLFLYSAFYFYTKLDITKVCPPLHAVCTLNSRQSPRSQMHK